MDPNNLMFNSGISGGSPVKEEEKQPTPDLFSNLHKNDETSLNKARVHMVPGINNTADLLVNGKDQKFDKDAFQRKLGVETPNNEESKGYLTGIPQDTKSMTSNESHPYMQFQKAAGENNQYLPQIPNWEGVKTFILPKEYALREFDAIQDHIEKEFNERNMRNILCENQYEYAKVHKCRRFNECLCRVFARDLLQLAYYKRVENVHKYLERFFLKPQVYLPFPELLLWLQLEIGRRNFKQAEAIMKKYIAYTTNLINDETKNVVSLELKKSSGPKDPWKAKPELLDLYESQYRGNFILKQYKIIIIINN